MPGPLLLWQILSAGQRQKAAGRQNGIAVYDHRAVMQRCSRLKNRFDQRRRDTPIDLRTCLDDVSQRHLPLDGNQSAYMLLAHIEHRADQLSAGLHALIVLEGIQKLAPSDLL